MSTVAIIGAGDLGGATAQALAARDRVNRLLLIDASGKVAAGKALDIRQSGAVDGFHCAVDSTDDFSAVTGAAACIVADRFAAPPVEWHGEDALAMLGRVLPYASGAPLIFAGVAQAELMLRVARELGVARERLIGIAPEAFASAVRAIVAVEARCSPSEVLLSVLGAPPGRRAEGRDASEGGFVVPWSDASIGGYALERVLSQVQLTRLDARARKLWPPGPFTLGLAAAHAAEAIVTSSRRTFSAATLLGGEFGVRNRIGTLPVRLSREGIAEVRVPALNTRERVRLETVLGAP
jgi:malate dehydrogenase